jgi:hypothetical protein
MQRPEDGSSAAASGPAAGGLAGDLAGDLAFSLDELPRMGAVSTRGASEDDLAGFMAEGLEKLALLADRMRGAQGEAADALTAASPALARALAAAARQAEAALDRPGTAVAAHKCFPRL